MASNAYPTKKQLVVLRGLYDGETLEMVNGKCYPYAKFLPSTGVDMRTIHSLRGYGWIAFVATDRMQDGHAVFHGMLTIAGRERYVRYERVRGGAV